VIFLLSSPAQARPPEVPDSLVGIEVVDTGYVKKAVQDKSAALLDALDENNSKHIGTIPGAINCSSSAHGIPKLDSEQVDQAVQELAACQPLKGVSKDREVIVFCKSKFCWLSPKAALGMKEMGFSNIKWYRLGSVGWKESGEALE
jgi:rhodanese-related sulfurtransferase